MFLVTVVYRIPLVTFGSGQTAVTFRCRHHRRMAVQVCQRLSSVTTLRTSKTATMPITHTLVISTVYMVISKRCCLVLVERYCRKPQAVAQPPISAITTKQTFRHQAKHSVGFCSAVVRMAVWVRVSPVRTRIAPLRIRVRPSALAFALYHRKRNTY